METHLTYDSKGKQLGILVKERFTTNQGLQLKVTTSRRSSSTLIRLPGGRRVRSVVYHSEQPLLLPMCAPHTWLHWLVL
jgi:hypothetical protein